MRTRPVYFKEFGAFLAAERDRRGWKQSDVASMAQRRGLTAVTRQVLLRLENGQTKSPDPSALRGLAVLYDLAYEDLVSRLVNERYGVQRDLIRHEGTEGSALPQPPGEPFEQVATRVQPDRRTRYQRTRDETAAKEIRAVIDRLIGLESALVEARKIAVSETGRHRRDRKVG